jgi:hypothetical protein
MMDLEVPHDAKHNEQLKKWESWVQESEEKSEVVESSKVNKWAWLTTSSLSFWSSCGLPKGDWWNETAHATFGTAFDVRIIRDSAFPTTSV